VAKKSIGEANVKLTVEGAEQVASKLKDVKADLEATADAAKSTGSKIDGGFRKAGDAIEGATAGVRKLTGSLTAVLGVFSALSLVFGTVFGVFIEKARKSREEAEELKEEISKIGDSANKVVDALNQFGKIDTPIELIDKREEEAVNEILKEREELLKKIKPLGNLEGGSGAERLYLIRQFEARRQEILKPSIEAENRIRAAAEDARNRIRQKEAEDDANRNKKKAEDQKRLEISLADQLETVRISALEGVDRIEAEYQRRRADRERAYQEAVEEGRQREAELLDSIDRQDAANTQKAIERIRQEGQARADIEAERQRQEQKRQEDAATRELAAALRETQRALADQARAINENTREVRGLRERVFNFTPDIRRVAENTSRRTR
jgi:hypothetical protein